MNLPTQPGWEWLDWPLARGTNPRIRAGFSTRAGGMSQSPFDTFNLGHTVDDDPENVAANRAALRRHLQLPTEPRWLNQVHGATVVNAATPDTDRADAAIAREPGPVCAILTADCLPLFVGATDGRAVALAHCGWRGIARGVIESTLHTLGRPASTLHAYLGPAIGPSAYEVRADMRDELLDLAPDLEHAFDSVSEGRWYADLYAMVAARLRAAGVVGVYGGERCTSTESAHFFSHRRDQKTGRMASLIWLE
ncbi:MAG: peptidoglycan editing factor PgeF [Pseudomonadota bacterium]